MKWLIGALVLVSLTVPAAGEPALDQNGAPHAWKGGSSGYTIIDFAASWCRPCWKVLPRLQSFAEDHPEIRVLVVAVDDEVSGRDRLVDELGLTLPVVWDEGHRIAEFYRPKGMPATFVLDPDGRVVYRHTGSTDADWNALVSFVEALPR